MHKLNEDELWNRVKGLEKKVVYTVERKRPNKVEEVTDKEIIITDRVSHIARKEVVDAYEHLWRMGELMPGKGDCGRFIHSVTPAILKAVDPEQVEVVHRGGEERFSGIRLRLNKQSSCSNALLSTG